MNASESKQNPVFDYRALRFLIGIVAFVLPIVSRIIAAQKLTSISASYHTDARDVFVGALFIIGAFLLAYNGHTILQKWVSKLAAVAAVLAATFPTNCDTCESDIVTYIHYTAAIVLFSTIAYFCLGPFREKTKGQPGKKGQRAVIYLVCGVIIVVCMVAIGLSGLIFSNELNKSLAITYYGEFVALWAFGVAWIVAGKVLPQLVDEEDMLKLTIRAQ